MKQHSLFGETLPTESQFTHRVSSLRVSDLKRLAKVPGFIDIFHALLAEGEEIAAPISIVVSTEKRSKVLCKKRNMNSIRLTMELRYRHKEKSDEPETSGPTGQEQIRNSEEQIDGAGLSSGEIHDELSQGCAGQHEHQSSVQTAVP